MLKAGHFSDSLEQDTCRFSLFGLEKVRNKDEQNLRYMKGYQQRINQDFNLYSMKIKNQSGLKL